MPSSEQKPEPRSKQTKHSGQGFVSRTVRSSIGRSARSRSNASKHGGERPSLPRLDARSGRQPMHSVPRTSTGASARSASRMGAKANHMIILSWRGKQPGGGMLLIFPRLQGPLPPETCWRRETLPLQIADYQAALLLTPGGVLPACGLLPSVQVSSCSVSVNIKCIRYQCNVHQLLIFDHHSVINRLPIIPQEALEWWPLA